jgi:hypothetical protein
MDEFNFDLRNKEDSIIFKLRDLLEDFEIIAGSTEIMVLISRPLANETVIQNLQAAIAATLFRFQSIDYVKKTYIKPYTSKKTKLILEQIAWAYAAHSLENLNDIEKIVTTKAISQLKKIAPESGKLYNFLSEKTHIDYDNHREFITVEQERNIIILSHTDYYEYAKVILTLADLFGIVWEISQYNYMNKKESVVKKGNVFIVKQNRPFLKKIKKHLNKLEKMKQNV